MHLLNRFRPGLRMALFAAAAFMGLAGGAMAQGTLSVGNLVYRDVDGNGRYDDGTDIGLDGVQMQIFAEGANPYEDAPLDQTVTTAGGIYFFQNLAAGNYFVFVPPDQFQSGGPLEGLLSVPGTGAPGDDDDTAGEDGFDDTEPWEYGIFSGTLVLAEGAAPVDAGTETGYQPALDNAVDEDGDLTVDFGFYRPASLGNLVFADMNGNNRADLGEGVPGVTVQLFSEVQDPAVDIPLADVTTAEDGHFLFSSLQAGTYQLHIPPSQFRPGGPLHGALSMEDSIEITPDDDAGEDGIDDGAPDENGISTAVITLNAGDSPTQALGETGLGAEQDDAGGLDADGDLTWDFGFVFPPDKVAVGNLVFKDSNGNNRADDGEGVEGVTVQLFPQGADPLGVPPLAEVTTANGGFFLFSNLDAGDYFLHIPADQFTNGAPLFACVSVTGEIAEGDDNVSEEGLDEGVPEVMGVSTPVFSLAAGMSVPDETGLGSTLDDFREENVDLTHDFGFVALADEPLAVGNLVYVDANHSGGFDDGEGLSGVVLRLFREGDDPELAAPVAETASQTGGAYAFTGLSPGSYFIHVPASEFGNGASLNGMYSIPGAGLDTDEDDDVDENGLDGGEPATDGVRTAVFALTDDDEPVSSGTETGYLNDSDDTDDNNTNLTIDLGFEEPCAFIALTPFEGFFKDGLVGVPYAQSQSAMGGTAPYVWSVSGELPPGLSLNASTGAVTGTPEMEGSWTFVVRATDANGCYAENNASAEVGPAPPPLSVGDTVAVDLNYDGYVDPGEGVAEVTVQLFTEGLDPAEDAPVAETETQGDGNYFFANLLPGNYFLHIPAQEFAPDGQLYQKVSQPGAGGDTFQNGNDDGLDAENPALTGVSTGVFELSPGRGSELFASEGESGEDDPVPGDPYFDHTQDFVFIASPEVSVSLGNLVFDDTANRNGRFDADEGIDGVEVQLYTAGSAPGLDFPLSTQRTTDGGRYRFHGLPPGDYVVHIPARAFQEGFPLRNMVSITGHTGDNGDDDDMPGENGIDNESPALNGISTETINLALGEEPTAEDSETGFAGTDDDGLYDSNADLTVDLGFVSNCPTIVISPGSLPAAVEGEAFSAVLMAGETAITPVIWSLSDGELPPGLTFNTETHTLEGTPTEQGTTFFSIRVVDANGCQGERTYELTVQSPVPLMGVGNLVFKDANGSGRYDEGEGAAGVTLQLYQDGAVPGEDDPVATTISNVLGQYAFTGLTVGDYFIHIPASQFAESAPLEGHLSIVGHGGDDGLDDNLDENGVDSATPAITGISSVVFHLAPGTEPTDADTETGAGKITDNADDSGFDATMDFGFAAPSSALLAVGNSVFADANRNGVFDFSEGVSGVQVQLFAAGASPQEDMPLATQTTNAEGVFGFTNLVPGSYFLHVPAAMFGEGQPLVGQLSVSGAGEDDSLDDDADENGLDALSPSATGVSTHVFTLGAGLAPIEATGETGHYSWSDDENETGGDSYTNLTIDFGFAHPPINISPIFLADGEVGQEYAQEFTAEGGTGPYSYALADGDLPPGLVLNGTEGTLAGVPSEAGNFSFTLQVEDANGGTDTRSYTVEIAPSQTLTLGNLVFFDSNANGRADSGEGVDGISVDLYSAEATPGVDLPVASQVTASGGRYLFGNLPPGEYKLYIPAAMFAQGSPLYHASSMAGVGSGDDDTGEDGADAVNPALTGVSTGTISLTPGMAPLNSTTESGLDFDTDDENDANGDLTWDLGFVDSTPLPATYSDWLALHGLGGQGAPTANADGDLDDNLLEYALLRDPESGVKDADEDLFHLEQNAGGGYDLWFIRRRGGAADLIFDLQLVTDLGETSTEWDPISLTPVVTINGDGTETVRFNNIQNDPALAGNLRGFARLRVALDANRDSTPEATVFSEVFGWGRRELATRNQTYAVPLMATEVAAGVVDGVNGNEVDLTTVAGAQSIVAHFITGRQYYLEAMDGDAAGHRWEVDEASSTATSVVLLPADARSTRATVPASLAGSRIAVRPHWRAVDLFPVADFNATNNPGTADQLLFFNSGTGGYVTLWLFSNGGSPQWVQLNDATLSDAGGRIIAPCEGLFTKPRAGSVDATLKGLVRTWPMACPLRVGTSFVGNPWPVDQSPLDRGMTTALGFTGAAAFTTADRIYEWNGDTAPSSSYTNYYLLLSGPFNQWVRQSDATLTDRSAEPRFKAAAAAFIISVNGKADWMLTPPYTP